MRQWRIGIYTWDKYRSLVGWGFEIDNRHVVHLLPPAYYAALADSGSTHQEGQPVGPSVLDDEEIKPK